MARRLIGLDVGTNAVTIAEVTPGTPPRLDMFAQVALPREAMREGEVADEGAVADAVARLRAEVGLKKAAVRVGISSPRVIVRQVGMPVMTRQELASALEFQAGELIPIAMEDAVLDFAILETNASVESEDEGGEPSMQVLLAAVQESTVARLVAAVTAGGLEVAAVDLVPLSLVRALARPTHELAGASIGAGGIALADDTGADGIVSFGGGVTSIVVHENGVPRFVRVLGTGGRSLTDAIGQELAVPFETAEALKRAIAAPGGDEMVARARAAMDRPLSVLLDEVRSSLDYYRNQPGAARLREVVVTGGSAQLPGLPERLGALSGVPVAPAYMHDLLRIGNIGFEQSELPRLEPYLPAAVGLALGGAGVGTAVNLVPKRRVTRRSRPKFNGKIGAGVAAAIVVLGGLTFVEHGKVSSAKSRLANAEATAQKLQNELARLQAADGGGGGVNLKQQAAKLLGRDVAWTKTVDDFGAALPPGVWLTTLQAQETAAVPTETAPVTGGATANPGATPGTPTDEGSAGTPTTGAGGLAGATSVTSRGSTSCASYQTPIAGTVTMAGIAKDIPSLAAFLDALEKAGGVKEPDVTSVFLSSAQKSMFGSTDVVGFSLTATLSDGARSDRLQTFFREALCK
jgi:type IV pilus assembly protein PilM